MDSALAPADAARAVASLLGLKPPAAAAQPRRQPGLANRSGPAPSPPRPAAMTAAALVLAVEQGLPRSALRLLAERIAPSPAAVEDIEHAIVSRTTLARRTSAGLLTREESEKTERLARLFTEAMATLGSEDEAREFLHRPHPMLANRTPFGLAMTELGGRQVEAVLQALQFGLPA